MSLRGTCQLAGPRSRGAPAPQAHPGQGTELSHGCPDSAPHPKVHAVNIRIWDCPFSLVPWPWTRGLSTPTSDVRDEDHECALRVLLLLFPVKLLLHLKRIPLQQRHISDRARAGRTQRCHGKEGLGEGTLRLGQQEGRLGGDSDRLHAGMRKAGRRAEEEHGGREQPAWRLEWRDGPAMSVDRQRARTTARGGSRRPRRSQWGGSGWVYCSYNAKPQKIKRKMTMRCYSSGRRTGHLLGGLRVRATEMDVPGAPLSPAWPCRTPCLPSPLFTEMSTRRGRAQRSPRVWRGAALLLRNNVSRKFCITFSLGTHSFPFTVDGRSASCAHSQGRASFCTAATCLPHPRQRSRPRTGPARHVPSQAWGTRAPALPPAGRVLELQVKAPRNQLSRPPIGGLTNRSNYESSS